MRYAYIMFAVKQINKSAPEPVPVPSEWIIHPARADLPGSPIYELGIGLAGEKNRD